MNPEGNSAFQKKIYDVGAPVNKKHDSRFRRLTPPAVGAQIRCVRVENCRVPIQCEATA